MVGEYMKHESFYTALRTRIVDYSKREGKDNLWMKYLLLAPDFFYLLCKLFSDERVNPEGRFKAGMAITYFINPLDFIPDFLISVGYLDDIVVASFVLSSILKYVNAQVLNEYWPAKRDVVEVIDDINTAAEKIIEGDILSKINTIFGDKI
jgi:uncharacterized membrane protein YkvA (DUF1232 family)